MSPPFHVPVDEEPPDDLEIVQRVAPLIERDLRLTLDGAIRCRVLGKDRGQVVFRATWPPEIRQDLWVVVEWSDAATIAKVVDALQESDFFDFYVEPWPRCGVHPDSTHSMTVREFRSGAWWICPHTGRRTSPVGSLAVTDDGP